MTDLALQITSAAPAMRISDTVSINPSTSSICNGTSTTTAMTGRELPRKLSINSREEARKLPTALRTTTMPRTPSSSRRTSRSCVKTAKPISAASKRRSCSRTRTSAAALARVGDAREDEAPKMADMPRRRKAAAVPARGGCGGAAGACEAPSTSTKTEGDPSEECRRRGRIWRVAELSAGGMGTIGTAESMPTLFSEEGVGKDPDGMSNKPASPTETISKLASERIPTMAGHSKESFVDASEPSCFAP
mmetsp:Transcript_97816/g.282218  ORF Transcript_97816/g.282218 Transcript_97816/m.282218 type:complete len:249 (+) Transcript_97816:1390-2136(+)